MQRTLVVEGMSCSGCEQAVETALESVQGVTRAEADHDLAQVTVEGEVDRDALVRAVEQAGYEVAVESP